MHINVPLSLLHTEIFLKGDFNVILNMWMVTHLCSSVSDVYN
jgi:hypothetical protein